MPGPNSIAQRAPQERRVVAGVAAVAANMRRQRLTPGARVSPPARHAPGTIGNARGGPAPRVPYDAHPVGHHQPEAPSERGAHPTAQDEPAGCIMVPRRHDACGPDRSKGTARARARPPVTDAASTTPAEKGRGPAGTIPMKLKPDIVKASEARGALVRRPPAAPAPSTASRPASGATRAGRKPPRAGASIRTDTARVRHLEFGGARPSATELERIIGETNDLVDEFYLERALLSARPVCRLILRDAGGREHGYATGFLVAPGLALTNWHVFPRAADAAQALAEFDYKFDVRGEPVPSIVFRVRADLFHLADKDLDFALVAIEPSSIDGSAALDTFGYHRLVADPHTIRTGEWITIIQHPGGRRRQFAIRENQLIAQPDPDFLWYASDTAQGSSGAPAFNDSFQVVALHHSGKARRDGGQYVLMDGRRVSSLEGVDDSEVDWEANEGLRVSALCRFLDAGFPAGAFRDAYLESTRGGDILTRMLAEPGPPPVPLQRAMTSLTGAFPPALHAGTLTIAHAEIHQVIIGGAAAGTRAASRGGSVTATDAPAFYERAVLPVIDARYENRKGYVDNLLGTRVPMPSVTKPSLVSRTDDGSHILPYQHFSIVVHKARRLALFTAANVTAFSRLKAPEEDHTYTRRALGGFGEHDTEAWLTDPRIPEQHQLPDTFYDKDRQSFDKGHLVRRDDVCWGTTHAEVQRANGDTYHTTNCSPQVKGFNRSASGGAWGRLENYILRQARSESYALFAGPVFGDDDEWFEGVDRRGVVRIQIPQAYWKVVVARGEAGLESFAFLLTQDLSGVVFEDEFSVTAAWAEHVVPIADLQSRLTGLRFPAAIHAADQSRHLPF